jgi:hypothetical protein
MPAYGKHEYPKTLRGFVVAMLRMKAAAYRMAAKEVEQERNAPTTTPAERRARIESWARGADDEAAYVEKPTTEISSVVQSFTDITRILEKKS